MDEGTRDPQHNEENPECGAPGSTDDITRTTSGGKFSPDGASVNGDGDSQYSNIPAELKELWQWVAWKFVPQPDGKKPKKVPINPATGGNAAVDNPQSWGTFAQAVAAVTLDTKVPAGGRWGLEGIGFMFTRDDPYAGIDLDGCRDPQTGSLNPFAHDAMQRVVSYTEASPSGKGLHIIAKGTLPAGGAKNGTVEMYDTGRYFTCTGEHIGGTPAEIQEQHEAVDALYREQFPEKLKAKAHPQSTGTNPTDPLSDEDVIAKATGATNGAKVQALLNGDVSGYPSASEAEMALCNQLAFYCGPDSAEQIDRIIRHHLKADRLKKWDEQHFSTGETYGQHTVMKALEGRTEFYQRRHAKPTSEAGTEEAGEFPLTDLGNGERFVKEHGRDFLFCTTWKKWLVWDGTRWLLDDTQTVRKRGRDTVRGIYLEAGDLVNRVADASTQEEKKQLLKQQNALLRHAVQSEHAARVNAMLDLAQMDLTILPHQFDTDLWALNVSNGTLDLRTGEIRPHARTDLLTKCVPLVYDPDATCPQWEAFLESILDGKQEVIDFLWKAVGYSLTGDTREDCLFLLHGTGANGKSTLLTVLLAVLADYGKQAAFSTFLHQERESVRNDLADLQGARLVIASEVDEGKRLSMSVVKALSGQDTMKARFLFKEFFSFVPQLKIWLAANHKPVIRGTDHAIWRRIRLIPFTQTFEGERKDPTMREKLLAERPGILAWAVRGCLAWQAEGLPLPEAVQAATADYRAESDVIGAFLEECCVMEKGADVLTATLYDRYTEWCKKSGEDARSKKAFGLLLQDRELEPDKGSGGIRIWKGIKLASTG